MEEGLECRGEERTRDMRSARVKRIGCRRRRGEHGRGEDARIRITIDKEMN